MSEEMLKENERIRSTPIAYHHEIHLDECFEDPLYERDVLSLLRNAKEQDTVEININSPGGNLAAAMPIVNAIRMTSAEVTGVLMFEAHSAASMVFLACTRFEVHPYCEMLIHSASYGSYGKQRDVKDHVLHTDKLLTSVCKDIYSGFLSEEEINDVLRGKELFMGHEEITERLKNKINIMNNERNDSEEE